MNNLVGCELRQDEIVVKMFQVVGGAGSRSSYNRKSLRKQNYQNRQLKVDLHTDDPRRGSYDMDDVLMDCHDDDHDKKSSGVGLQSRSLLSVMEHVEDWQKRSSSRQSVCIISKDGCSRAGLYCTISICCDQLKTEKEIDVFSAVRYVRTHRPQMVPTIEEYRYIYHFMMEYALLSKSRPDIIITQPVPSIFTCSDFEKSTDTMAIIANSLHGGVYIRKQPVQPDVNQPVGVGNSTLNNEYSSSKVPDLKNDGQSGIDDEEEDNQSNLHTNLVASLKREIVPSVGNQSSPKELVVGRGAGTLSNSMAKDSHLKVHPSCDDLSLTQPITQTAGVSSLTGLQPLSAVSLLSIANSYGKHSDEAKLQTPSLWSNHLKDSQSLSCDINISPCASASYLHHASQAGDLCDQISNMPMQSTTDSHLQKCFLSPGVYAQGSQLNKASLSSLCTNSSFHSCHSNLSEALSQTAGSPKPRSHTSNSGLCGGGFNFVPNGFHPHPFSDIDSSSNRCVSFTSLSTDLPKGMHNSWANHLNPTGMPLRTPAESTLIHASYASLEDSVGDSLEDHYSSLDWVEQNNNAHIFKQGIQAEVTARNDARFMAGKVGMRHSLFSRSKVIPWPSPLNFVKKVKEYRLSKRKTLISDT